MVEKRRTIELLPVALQTETLTKFFSATLDHLLQPESVEFLSGYIGSKPSYYNSTTDYYVNESTKTREDYQLPVAAVNADLSSGATKNIMFYDDIVNLLKFHGANVDNHSRLFDQEFYSWAPPIDIDKLVNYTKYLWLPNGPSTITLLDTTDAVSDIIGKSTYVYTGAYRLESTGAIVTGSSLTFSVGMAIAFSQDLTASYNNTKWMIDGVGQSIQLVKDTAISRPSWNATGWNINGWNGTDALYTKQYITIGRYSVDKNQWSQNNRWFHEDVVNVSRTSINSVSIYRALRPIVEYDRNILLWNYGWYGRPDVDLLVYNLSNIYDEIVGRASYIYDSVPLADGMRILVINDSDPTVTNRIYEVNGINDYSSISLTLATDGQNADGSPALGDRCVIKLGTYSVTNAWFTPGGYWENVGQQVYSSIGPNFALFDIYGNGFVDPSVYPNSDFNGSTIFGYINDPTNSPYDAELGFYPKRDQFGSFVFSNNIVTDVVNYREGATKLQYTGYKFYQTRNVLDGTYIYGNSWHKSSTPSRQFIVNDYISIQVPNRARNTLLSIDQFPEGFDFAKPSTIDAATLLQSYNVVLIRDRSTTTLKYDTHYSFVNTTDGPKLSLNPHVVKTGDRVTIRTWNKHAPMTLNGYYELPLNLTANPNNKEITNISQSQLLLQFQQIIENQYGFNGIALGNNNYRDTAADLSRGRSILQHRAPMLKLMVLGSSDVITGVTTTQSNTDPMLAMQFAQKDYVRLYSRFIKTLNTLYKNGYSLNNSVDDWIASALKQINVGKTKSSTWANSGYDLTQGTYCYTESTDRTYIPPTASRLGVAPTYRPEVYMLDEQLVIQTHDGSRIIMEDDTGARLGTILNNHTRTIFPALLSNPIAKAWLQFEINIFNSIPDLYRATDAELVFDVRDFMPGKWRDADYTKDEYTDIMRPMFDKWVIVNQVDYTANTTFDVNDQFTFNYRQIVDTDGQPVPGNWRGIYRWFYDTDRPHTHPWEMLGFSQKPAWWDSEYGPSPYTRGNTRMWRDLQDGIIRYGARAGTYSTWARPGLLACIPVDKQGNLLPPLAAGTVSSLPSISQAKESWVFGDGAPVESVWQHSQDHNFAIAQSSYLMKPARFIEYCWDTPRSLELFSNSQSAQWVYIDTNSRRSSTQFYVHRENPVAVGMGMSIPNESEFTYFGSCGVQHWISEYLISKSLDITSYFGSLVRGSQPRLAHKVGAFIDSDNNSLRLTADSFGNIGYRSQMVPSENINTFLYRSTSIGESFYGGVIVKQVSTGWQIYGFDGINPFFNVIPDDTRSTKSTMTIGNQTIVFYASGIKSHGEPVVSRVMYGTIFSTRQEVCDFISSYGRYLENQGWVFDSYDNQNNILYNWKQSAIEFCYWSQAVWANGNFIALSPLANSAKFKQEFGNIEFVNGIVNGTYPVLDRSGSMINAHNLEILRYNDEIVVRPMNEQSIYGLRLFRTTIEHVIVLDSITSFGDTIYDDQYNLAQPRLKIYAYRTNDWTGRLDAPGYFLYQNTDNNTWTMLPNLEKTANDVRKYFNIEQPRNFDSVDSATGVVTTKSSQNSVIDRSDISDLSKHTFGYQKRDYLQNLLLEDSTEYEFYQGFMRQKGTSSTIDKLLRNTSVVGANETFEYYEEFAFRTGRYGATALNTSMSFILPQSQFINTPQQINLFGDLQSNREANGIIEFIPNDPKFVSPPADQKNSKFPLRTFLGQDFATDLPTAGYVQLAETDWYVTNASVLSSLFKTNIDTNRQLANRDTIWQFIDVSNGWMVWQYTKTPATVINTTPSTTTGQPTVINCNGPHGLTNGDMVTLTNIANVDVLNGTYIVQNVNSYGNTFQVPQNSFTVGTGGDIHVYQKVRFGNVSLRDSNSPVGGWETGDIAWVDQSDIGINGWTVYQKNDIDWTPIRAENYKIDATLMTEATLFSVRQSSKLVTLNYYDPAKGIIPGLADADIDTKSVSDPARYNKGDATLYPMDAASAWGNENVGLTWWDLSTVRYIDYEIGDNSYRWKNWGKIAPGTSIDIYEWVRSPVPPSNWASYAAQGQSFSQYGVNYTPSGAVKNATNPAWTQEVDYDQNGNPKTWYYFWVANATTLPLPANRTKTTQEIKNILQNPDAYGVSWYAAIDPANIIVSNVIRYLNSNDTMMQMVYTQKVNDSNDHKQWALAREGDQASTIDSYFWTKLHDSLIGFDGLGNPVPDMNLNAYQRYGTLIRPRQSWFKDRIAAATIYINKINSLLSNIALRDDPDKLNWVNYFFNEEPIPAQDGNYDFTVDTLAQRNALTVKIQNGQTVLVRPVPDNSYRWVIYQWVYATRSWKTVRIQQWKTQNYWQYIDYYNSTYGISASTIPTYTVSTLSDLNNLTVTATDVVKVLNNGNNLWELYQSISKNWIRVGLEAGTVQVLSSIYDTTGYVAEFGGDTYDELGFDINPYIEFSNIINAVNYAIFGSASNSNSIELNTIFFSMINYVLQEQGFVDWIIKTSYLVLKGFNQPLSNSELYQSDNIDSLLAYINEVRPYRSKVRQFISGRTTTSNVSVVSNDFDKPVYEGRVLDPNNSADVAILSTDRIQRAWYNNYKKNYKLIRTLKTKILFDRVASRDQGWSTFAWDVRPWAIEAGNNAKFGAFDRIKQYYAPTAGMIPVTSDELISGTAFKGVILGSLGFDASPGWNKSPWNISAGWNASDLDFSDYLDIIVQGGAIPEYDSFYANGTTTTFKLSKVPQDVSETAVWSNNVLRQYGVDWIIPNWIVKVSIVNGGTGYQIGDILQLTVPNAVSQATVLVTSVAINGAITAATIQTRGQYDFVPHGPFAIESIIYHESTGSGAVVQPMWGGDTLVLNDAPSASSSYAVHVLFSGETFDPALDGEYDIINDGYGFVQPTVAADHAEELYNAKLKESIRLDVYTTPVGGHPTVYIRSYETDGILDQFDLAIKPQSTSSVIATLNGNLLQYGVDHDYVINFYTNKVVFVVPPTAGKLQLLTIGAGGTGLGIYKPYVINSGNNYAIGDIVTLTNGSRYDIAGGADRPAKVIVSSLTSSNVAVVSGGTGYSVGDILVLNDTPGTTFNSKMTVAVSNVIVGTGEIIKVHVGSNGDYQHIPSDISWSATGTSTGNSANISVTWGAASLEVYDQGLYTDAQASPFYDAADLNAPHSETGSGLTVNALMTSTMGTATFVADGVNSTYTVDFAVQNSGTLLVTIDGIRVDPINIRITGQDVYISTLPDENSTVTITSFNTDKFSVVSEYSFKIQPNVWSYGLPNMPASTMPPYASILVLRNNILMRTPPMTTYVADGVRTVFELAYVPLFAIGLYVYVDSITYVNNVDYTVTPSSVIFTTPPAAGAKVVLLVVNGNYGYDYELADRSIKFPSDIQSGWDTLGWDSYYGWLNLGSTVDVEDTIRVISFTEDLSYGWISEELTSNGGNEYTLQGVLFDHNTIMVFVDGIAKNILWDYTVDYGDGKVTTIKFNPTAAPTIGSKVLITYGTGLDDRPPIAWRTLISSSGTTSTTAIDNLRKTEILSDVFSYTTEIEVSDITKIGAVVNQNAGLVWIGNELIAYYGVVAAGTVEYPNRGFLTDLRRGFGGTPSYPTARYNTLYYYGDGVNRYFATESGTAPITETIYVDGKLQISNEIDNTIGTYSIQVNPSGVPAGRYVVFNTDSIPSTGWKNVKIAALDTDTVSTNPVHIMGTTVIDGGPGVALPGGYNWEAAVNGLQYSKSTQARFLREHQGTQG